MDASDGATTNGNGKHVPEPGSLPSAAVPPQGGPVSPATPAAPAGPPVPVDPKRKENGQFGPKNNANPRGNYKHTPNLNTQLIKALKHFTLEDAVGKKHTFLEALIKRALQEPSVCAKLLDKIFVDVTPSPAGLTINNHPTASASASSETNVTLIAKLLADAGGREDVARFTERVAACGGFSRDAGNVRN